MDRLPRFRKPESEFRLPALEEAVLARWRAEGAVKEVLGREAGRPRFVFYEGPPTANGRPGIHHVLARTLKDVVCRYRTMKGCFVPRKAGWDTHGLPVEIEVQKELGIAHKPEIESFGVGPFNERCRASVFRYKEEWERLSERMGYWLDYERPYVTCDNAYVSSLWSILARFHDEGLLERGTKSLPWCPRCGTGLSSHELAQGYEEIQDPSVFVRFPRAAAPGESFLAWTTTPWTLPSNVALAVSPRLEYARVRRKGKDGREEVLILAASLVPKVLAKDEVEVLGTLPGAALAGERCERPFDWMPLEGGRGEVVVAADFVSAEEGTGIVHVAPAFGADDHECGAREGLAIVSGVDAQGRMHERCGPVAGRFFRDANSEIVRELERRGRLLRRETVVHSYPHCWRCKTPLMYWLRPSWYLRTTRLREKLVALNRAIEWFPPETGSGRFGEWLENNVDWALSRERYWGTPLNLWICGECGHERAVRSEADLRALAPGLPAALDLHRPQVDGIELPCGRAGCRGRARRTPEVVDCWFDSGAMPFAQHGWIARAGEPPPADHPADYIAEGLDQTRGWFYTLHVISAFLTGKPASKRILVSDLVLDANKQKMSKSRGNAVDPWREIEAHGVDAVRWYLIAQSQPWLPKAYDPEAVGATGRELFGTLFNCWSFFATYAEIDGFDPDRSPEPPVARRPELDRWLLAELEALVEACGAAWERYDLTRAAQLVGAFVDRKLSNWYIRRSRERFWGSDDAADKGCAFHTLFDALRTLARLLAPLAPFFADALWRWLEPEGRTVHLQDWPQPRPDRRDPELERDMAAALDVVALGRRARSAAGIHLRQPLQRIFVKGADARADDALAGRFAAIVAGELNVHEVRVAAGELDSLRELRVKPNFRLLGPKLGPRLGAAKKALESLATPEIEAMLRDGSLDLTVAGGSIRLTSEELEVQVLGRPGFGVETDGRTLVALDTTLTPELEREGAGREIVKRVNNTRREAGLRVEDRIVLWIGGAAGLADAAQFARATIGADTLAIEVRVGGEAPAGAGWFARDWDVDGEPLRVALRKA